MTIRNPVEWSADGLRMTTRVLRSAGQAFAGAEATASAAPPEVRRIGLGDLGSVLRQGFDDFVTNRTDVIFVCLIYPVIGLLLAYVTARDSLLPLLFPVLSGSALVGPLAAVGTYEMSRRREQGQSVSWVDAFGVFGSPCIAQIIELGLLLVVIFLAWLTSAMLLYEVTLGSAAPPSIASLLTAVFSTAAGWTLLLMGLAVGCLFALLVLVIGAVSFPLLLDRHVGIRAAIETSARAVKANPLPMLVWGGIVAAGLVLGTLPALLGLIVVLPVLGHATWHLYRRVVV